MDKFTIVIPVYNEAKNLKILIPKIYKQLKNEKFELIVVDDNSPDKTGLEVTELQKRFSNLFLKSRPKKKGLGTAYIEGFKWALKKKYDFVVQMDADL